MYTVLYYDVMQVKIEETKLTAQQAKEAVALFKFADPQHVTKCCDDDDEQEACMAVYPAVGDAKQFTEVTLTALKFKEGMIVCNVS